MINLQTDIPGPESGRRKGKQRPGQITCGQKYGKMCQKQLNKKKSKSVLIEKPKVDNARKLRGIYFIDPKDAEFKETIEKAWKKLEIPMEAAMPCKIRRSKHGET